MDCNNRYLYCFIAFCRCFFYKSQASNEYTVQLKDVNNRVLADKFITVKFNNESYTLVTDKNGTASINLTVIKGSFEVKSYFKGDSKYNDAHSSDIVIK